MEYEDFNNDQDAIDYLHFATGNRYVFAVSNSRIWSDRKRSQPATENPFYQIMPVTEDDGFFDWYCSSRPDNQFFLTKEMCVLYFIRYWLQWCRTGKPKA
jgi:hypothetical protein